MSVYDFKRAIEDGATLPLRYLNRGEKLGIENPDIDQQMAEILEDENLDEDQKRKLTFLFQRDYTILTAEKRLDAIAKDLVWHFNERGYQGKAMYVALDKPTAVRMYELVMKYWPDYVAELKQRIRQSADIEEQLQLERKLKKVEETEVCVVVSPEQNEVDKFRKMGLDIGIHRQKMVERDLEKEFKDDDHPFRLAIVCAMWITGFDAPCVSTVYLDKPIKGHTLMQTIARANRVYNDEKENGLIVDYGNVYKQLEKAYAVYGEGGKTPGKGAKEKPVEKLEELAKELGTAITELKNYLQTDLRYSLDALTDKDLKPMSRLGEIKRAVDAVCLNETSRTTFEMMARNVFRKYHALYPEKQAKRFLADFNAIEAVYNQLNQKVKEADVTEIILRLQSVVDESIIINQESVGEDKNQYIDLSRLDFEKLRRAFQKTEKKNSVVYDLQEAITKKLEQMYHENSTRSGFYERYTEIIETYNNGKNLQDTVAVFEKLTEFVQDLNFEDQRAMREGLDQETLTIFDLLKSGKMLNDSELKEVKKVAAETLEKLKTQKLNIERWRESRQVTSQVKTMIFDHLQWLPQPVYSDQDVFDKTGQVYQHVYTYYAGV